MANALAPELAQLVEQEGLAADLDEALRQRAGKCSEPRGQAARQDHDREERLVHWLITRVPSKSNRKRTSFRPASAMVLRSLARSSA